MPPRPRTPGLLLLVLAAALAVRVGFALHKGLVLDELHSLHHASRPDLASFFESLRADNHAPLALLVIAGARRLFGDSELALRSPAIVYGMLELVLVARLARRAGLSRRWWAVALLAASSLHLDFSTQVRMYALLSLAVTGLTDAALGRLGGERRSAAWIALWTFVGLHAHYYFLHYLLGLGAAVLVAAALDRGARPRVPGAAGAVALAGAAALPWYLWGFREQLGHGLPPGGDDVGLAGLAEGMVHLFFLNVRIGGPALRVAFVLCGGLALVASAWGLARLVRDRETRSAGVLLAATGFVVPVTATLVAQALPRAGFTWSYVLPSAAPLAVAIAAAARPALGRAAAGTVLAAAATLSVLNATSRGTEDFPGAVRLVLDEHRPGDAVVSVEWQPALFPQGMPWDYYAPRLADAPPERLAMRGYTVADPGELRAARRVLLLRSKLPADQPLMQLLARHFTKVSERNFGFGRDVLVFERVE